jgi:ribosome-binding factor A
MSIRQEQIQKRLIEEVSSMLLKELKDPRLGFITVTGAEVTRDLRNAKVYISVLGDENARTDALAALKRASGMIRGEFARRAHLRVAPELVFQADEGIGRGARIFELLHEIEAQPKSIQVEETPVQKEA